MGPDGVSSRVRLAVGGDVAPVVAPDEDAGVSWVGRALARVADLLRAADLSVVNLEAPLVDRPSPIQKSGPHLGAPSAAAYELAAAGVNVVGIANNHVRDHGDEGVCSTLRACDRAGIRTVGAGLSLAAAESILVEEVNGVRVGVLAACEREFSHATNARGGANPIDPIRLWRRLQAAQADRDVLVVLLHAGKEMYPYPTPRQQALCRFLVDNGAHVVVCQHSHCPGCFERYNGSLIVYGQGNLLFPWPGERPRGWYEGVLVDVTLTGAGLESFRLVPYVQCQDGHSVVLEPPGRGAEIVSAIEARTERIHAEGEVEALWEAHCREQRGSYLFWLVGGGWMEPLRYRLTRRLGLRYRPLRAVDAMRVANLLRCDTHREVLEKILEENDT